MAVSVVVPGLAAVTEAEAYADAAAASAAEAALSAASAAGYAGGVYLTNYGWVADTDATLTAPDINPDWIGRPLFSGDTPTNTTTPWLVGDRKQDAAFWEGYYAAYASRSTPGVIITNRSDGAYGLNRPLNFPAGTTRVTKRGYMSMNGFIIQGQGSLTSRLEFEIGPTESGIIFDGSAYGTIRDLMVASVNPNHGALFDFDYTGANPGLKCQHILFSDLLFEAGNAADYAIRTCHVSGGNGQCSEFTYISSTFSGFDLAAVAVNGFNALTHNFYGCDFLGCNKFGVSVVGGWAKVHGGAFENQGKPYYHTPNYTQHTTAGADLSVSSQAGSGAITALSGTRSESDKALRSRYSTSASDAVVVGAGVYTDSRNNLRTNGMVFSEGTRGRTYMVVGEGTATGCTLEYAAMPAGIPGQNLTTITGFTGLPTSGSGLVGLYFQSRFESGFTYFGLIASNTSTAITIGSWTDGPGTSRVQGTQYKISGRSAASGPAWDSSVEGFRVVAGTGEGFTTTAGSANVTLGGAVLAHVDVGGYVVIDGAYTLSEGDYTYTVALCAKVLAIVGSVATLDRQATNSVTDAMGWAVLAANVIADGSVALFDYPYAAFETQGSLYDCGSNYGVVFSACNANNYNPNVDSGSGGRPDWARSLTRSIGHSYLGQAPSSLTPTIGPQTGSSTVAYNSQTAALRMTGIERILTFSVNAATIGAGGSADFRMHFPGITFSESTPRGSVDVGGVTWATATPAGITVAPVAGADYVNVRKSGVAAAAIASLQWSELPASNFVIEGEIRWFEDQS